MTKITIRTDEVKPGDNITVGGHTLTVTSINPGRDHSAPRHHHLPQARPELRLLPTVARHPRTTA